MTFILGLLSVVAVVACLLLMFVILLQEPKGGGLAAALGGSGMEALGSNAGAVNRFTCWVAGIWIAACLIHALAQPPGAVVGEGTRDTTAENAPEKPGTGDPQKEPPK
ncbi:MAG: hypothetical protein HMLKMBBP_01766 [Planctomycetes bacterium]|nr:hypothetical protein [Planctomycetota bacterium]